MAESIDFISTCNIFGLALWYLWLVMLVMNIVNGADHTLELSGDGFLYQEHENAIPHYYYPQKSRKCLLCC